MGFVAGALRARAPRAPATADALYGNNGSTIILIVFGALLPDISLFIMFAYAQMTNVPNEIIWSEMYYSPFWQNLGAITNSGPIFLMSSVLSWFTLKQARKVRPMDHSGLSNLFQSKQVLGIAFAVWVVSLSALLHVATDLPLHHDDGHPHFWPFTHWIFASPVSYWDAAHHANVWVPIECILGLTLVAIIWKKTSRIWAKGLLLLVALSYPTFTLFFFTRM